MATSACQLSDAELVSRIRVGEGAAELSLWERYRSRVRLFLIRRLGAHDEFARDIEQEVFIALVHAVREGRLLEDGNVGAYVYKVSENLVARWREKSKRSTLTGWVDPGMTEDNPETFQIESERRHRLRRLLDALGPEERRILDLRFGQELSYRQIGEELKLSEDAARQRVCRIIAALRRRLEEE